MKIFQIFPILREKIPTEKIKILPTISPMVISRDTASPRWLSPCMRREKIFHCARLVNVIISLIKRTGTTDRAPAIIPSQNLRAPSGELSRYENIYPQMRMGRKVMIIIGMSEKNSMFSGRDIL